MNAFTALAIALLALCVSAQDYEFESSAPRRPAPPRIQPGYSGAVETRPTPVPILKQINRHNEDGSYTYGYEGADGSFKIETKNPTGEVKGKYGYVDGDGKLRVVEYGANKYGFQPSGEGITVAPPTLVDETTNKDAQPDFDYYEPEPQPRPAPVRTTVARPRPQPRPQPKYQDFSVPQSTGPVPSRPLNIPGAIPSGVTYSEQPRAISRPTQPQYIQSSTFGSSGRAYTAPSAPERFAPQFGSARQQTSPIQFSDPAPVRQAFDDVTYAAPAPRPVPQRPVQFAPAPIQQRSLPSQGRTSVLDQLAKDYALPEGGSAPLHDISFGYY